MPTKVLHSVWEIISCLLKKDEKVQIQPSIYNTICKILKIDILFLEINNLALIN